MHIISRKALRAYWEEHPASEQVLDDWFRKIKQISPTNFAELRQSFPSADIFGKCVVFNVGGNNYRVITHVNFKLKKVFIRYVLSHAEYNKDKWKHDC
jgi:mRNA interferase HigB